MGDEGWVTKFGKIEGYGYAGTLSPLGFCGNGDVILDDCMGNLTRCSLRDEATLLKCSKASRLKPNNWVYIVCIDSLVSLVLKY